MKEIIYIIFIIPFLSFSQTFELDIERPMTEYNDASNYTNHVRGSKIKKMNIVHYGGGGLSEFDQLDSLGKDNRVVSKIAVQYNKSGKSLGYEKDFILFKEGKRFEYDSLNRLVKIIYSKWTREFKEYDQNEVFEYHDKIIKRHRYYKNDLEEIYCSMEYHLNEKNFLIEIRDPRTCFRSSPISTYQYDENGNEILVEDDGIKYEYDKHGNLLSYEIFEDGSDTPLFSHKYTYNDKQQLIDHKHFYKGKLDGRNEYKYENDRLLKEITHLRDGKNHYDLYYYDTKGNWIRKEQYVYPEAYDGIEKVRLVDIYIRNIQYW